MTLDERALELLRRHGPRLRLNIECYPLQKLAFHVSVWSDLAQEWIVISRSNDPSEAIVDALSPADFANIYDEAVH